MIGKPKSLANLKIAVEKERVIRRLRGGGNTPPSLDSLVENELEVGHGLMEPKACYVDLSVLSVVEGRCELSGDFTLTGKSATKLLSGCSCATIFVATIGGELEEEVERRFSSGDKAGGLILDTIGSEGAESLARRVQLIIHERAKREGSSTTGRLSPGYGDLSLSAQERIVEITGANKIGVSLTERLMLSPRKSVSAIVGWRNR